MSKILIFVSHKDPSSVKLYEWAEEKLPGLEIKFISIHEHKDLVNEYEVDKVPMLITPEYRLVDQDIVDFLKTFLKEDTEKNDTNFKGIGDDDAFCSLNEPIPSFNSISESTSERLNDNTDINKVCNDFLQERKQHLKTLEINN